MDRWSVHVAGLIGIFYAVNMVYKLAYCSSIGSNKSLRQQITSCLSRYGRFLVGTSCKWITAYYPLMRSSSASAQETVSHVLMICPKLRELRSELKIKSKEAFNVISSLLGGSNKGQKFDPDTVSRSKAVQVVLDFAEAPPWLRSCAS